jgi:hypothetical protein
MLAKEVSICLTCDSYRDIAYDDSDRSARAAELVVGVASVRALAECAFLNLLTF